MIRNAIKIVAAAAAMASAGAAFAHVTLQDQAAAAGASYRGVLRVGHGCEGASTVALRVTVPDGFNGAQPMVKAGWKVSTVVGKLPEPYEAHGKKFTEGVREITWTVENPANALPDAHYDEFVLRGTTPAKPGPLWFKVEQLCEKGQNNWTEVPATGSSTKGLKSPAALLEVLDMRAAEHKH